MRFGSVCTVICCSRFKFKHYLRGWATTSGKKWTYRICMQNNRWSIRGDELLTKSPIELKRNTLLCWVFLGNHSFTSLFPFILVNLFTCISFAYHWCSLWWCQIGCSWQKIGGTPYLEPWKRQVAMLTATWQSATTMWTWTQLPDMALLWATLLYVKASPWKLLFLLWNWCIQNLCFVANGIETICTQSLSFIANCFRSFVTKANDIGTICIQKLSFTPNSFRSFVLMQRALHSEAFFQCKLFQKLCFNANGIETIYIQKLCFQCKLFQKLCFNANGIETILHPEALLQWK